MSPTVVLASPSTPLPCHITHHGSPSSPRLPASSPLSSPLFSLRTQSCLPGFADCAALLSSLAFSSLLLFICAGLHRAAVVAPLGQPHFISSLPSLSTLSLPLLKFLSLSLSLHATAPLHSVWCGGLHFSTFPHHSRVVPFSIPAIDMASHLNFAVSPQSRSLVDRLLPLFVLSPLCGVERLVVVVGWRVRSRCRYGRYSRLCWLLSFVWFYPSFGPVSLLLAYLFVRAVITPSFCNHQVLVLLLSSWLPWAESIVLR